MKTLLVGALLLGVFASLDAQVPRWADSALVQSGFWTRYDLTSRLNPQVGYGDFDGDGLWDVAIAIVDHGGRRRGFGIVHQIDRSVHVVGAGNPIGTGPTQLAGDVNWGVGKLLGHRAGIRVADWHSSAWIVWDGHTYVWVPDSQ